MQREQHTRLQWDAAADRHTETAGLTAGFDRGRWQWAIGHIQTMSFNHGQPAPFGGNHLMHLDLSLPAVHGLKLNPELKWNVFKEYQDDTETSTLSAALKSSTTLIPKSLEAKLDLNAKQRHSDDQARDCRSIGVDSSLDWTVRPQQAKREAVTVFVSSRYDYAEHAACSDPGKAGVRGLCRAQDRLA